MFKKEIITEEKTPLQKSIKEPIESKNLSSNNKKYEIVKKDENTMSNGSSSNSAKRAEKNLKKNNTGGPNSGSGWVTVQKKRKNRETAICKER